MYLYGWIYVSCTCASTGPSRSMAPQWLYPFSALRRHLDRALTMLFKD